MSAAESADALIVTETDARGLLSASSLLEAAGGGRAVHGLTIALRFCDGDGPHTAAQLDLRVALLCARAHACLADARAEPFPAFACVADLDLHAHLARNAQKLRSLQQGRVAGAEASWNAHVEPFVRAFALFSAAERDARDAALLDPGASAPHGCLGEVLAARCRADKALLFSPIATLPNLLEWRRRVEAAHVAFARAAEIAPAERRWADGRAQLPPSLPDYTLGNTGIVLNPLDLFACAFGGGAIRSVGGARAQAAADAGPGPACRGCARRPPAGCELLRCGRCLCVFYCGAGCQRADWTGHKKDCAAPVRAHTQPHTEPSSVPEQPVRMHESP